MPPPRYCFGLLFSDLLDRLLFKTHQKFKMALGERSESVRNYVKVNSKCRKKKRLNQGSNLKSSDVVSDVLPLHH